MKNLDNPSALERLIYGATGAFAGFVIGWGVVLAYSHFIAPFPGGMFRFGFFMALVIPLAIISAVFPQKMRWLLTPFALFMHFLP